MAALILALPAAAIAQRGPGPRARRPNPAGATALIALRQQLNLTPRQVATLDSMERAQRQRNQAARERFTLRRDSLLAGRNLRTLTPDERAALRARLDSLRPLRQRLARSDSASRAAAMGVLSDAQRTRARELLTQRRAYAQGWRAGRAAGPGLRGARPGAGPRAGRAGGPMVPPMRQRMQGPPMGARNGPPMGPRPGAQMRQRGPMNPPGGVGPMGPRARMQMRGRLGPPDSTGAVPPMGPGAGLRMRARMRLNRMVPPPPPPPDTGQRQPPPTDR